MNSFVKLLKLSSSSILSGLIIRIMDFKVTYAYLTKCAYYVIFYRSYVE